MLKISIRYNVFKVSVLSPASFQLYEQFYLIVSKPALETNMASGVRNHQCWHLQSKPPYKETLRLYLGHFPQDPCWPVPHAKNPWFPNGSLKHLSSATKPTLQSPQRRASQESSLHVKPTERNEVSSHSLGQDQRVTNDRVLLPEGGELIGMLFNPLGCIDIQK